MLSLLKLVISTTLVGGVALHPLNLSPSLILPLLNSKSDPPLNQSFPLNLPSSDPTNGPIIQCDGLTYGFFSLPERQDCQFITKGTRSDEETVKFAQRGTPLRTGSIIPLPWRWMGRIYFVFPMHNGSNARVRLIRTCSGSNMLRSDSTFTGCYAGTKSSSRCLQSH